MVNKMLFTPHTNSAKALVMKSRHSSTSFLKCKVKRKLKLMAGVWISRYNCALPVEYSYFIAVLDQQTLNLKRAWNMEERFLLIWIGTFFVTGIRCNFLFS